METLVRFLRVYLVHTTTIQTLSKPFAETFLPFFRAFLPVRLKTIRLIKFYMTPLTFYLRR